MNKLTPRQLIIETLEYYTGHPERFSTIIIKEKQRDGSIEEEAECMYLSPSGAMCAFGRCLDKEGPHYQEIVKGSNNVGANIIYKQLGFDEIFYPQYVEIKLELWVKLQQLHDTNFIQYSDSTESLWTPEAQLTDKGKEFVDILYNQFPD